MRPVLAAAIVAVQPPKGSHTTSPGSVDARICRSDERERLLVGMEIASAAFTLSRPCIGCSCQTLVRAWVCVHLARMRSHAFASGGNLVQGEIGVVGRLAMSFAPIGHCRDRFARREIPEMTLRQVFSGGSVRNATSPVGLVHRQAGALPLCANPFLNGQPNTGRCWQQCPARVADGHLSNHWHTPNCLRVTISRDVRNAFVPNNSLLIMPPVQIQY